MAQMNYRKWRPCPIWMVWPLPSEAQRRGDRESDCTRDEGAARAIASSSPPLLLRAIGGALLNRFNAVVE